MFLIKVFFHMAKYQDKNLNILRTKRTFKVKQKAFFITFKRVSVTKNYPRLESAPLSKHELYILLVAIYCY